MVKVTWGPKEWEIGKIEVGIVDYWTDDFGDELVGIAGTVEVSAGCEPLEAGFILRKHLGEWYLVWCRRNGGLGNQEQDEDDYALERALATHAGLTIAGIREYV